MFNNKKNKVTRAVTLGLAILSQTAMVNYAMAFEKEQIEEVEEQVERINVVGSRIKKLTFESASPITVVSSETLMSTGLTNLADALAELPQLGIGTNLGNSTNGTTSANLRGAGAKRTLTLIDGKRAVASTISGTTVDLSTIPIGMVDQVEILTGGASAVYGSDALSGVINIKLKKNIEGIKLSANATFPELGAGKTQQFSISAGGSFDEGRGRISAGFNFSNSDPILQTDRDFVSGEGYISTVSNPENGDSSDGIPDVLIVRDIKTGPYPSTGGLRTWNYATSQYDNYYLNDAGDFVINDRTFYGYYTEGGPGFNFGEYGFQVQSAQEALSAMINLDYDISDDVEFYSSVHLSKTDSESLGQPTYTEAAVYVSVDNPTLPASVRDWMIDNGKSNLSGSNYDYVLRTFEDFGRQNTLIARDLLSASFGLKGMFYDWDWDVSFQHGRSSMTMRGQHQIYKDRLAMAFDAVEDADGNAVCRATIDPDQVVRDKAKGCLPLAIFGHNTDQAAIDWVTTTSQMTNSNEQTIISGYVSGSLFDLPSGPLNIVLGSEYREEIIEQEPDSATYNGNIVLGGLSARIQPVSLDVTEIFTEIDVPVMDNLSLNGSYRYSDYSSIGGVSAWGLGIDYQVIEDLKFRASASESVRAPSVYDLNNPGSLTFASVDDLCHTKYVGNGDNPEVRKANCIQEVGSTDWQDPRLTETKSIRLGGNPNLVPEDAETLTAGVVITPTMIENLNISIDWWKIELTNEITQLSASQILEQCYDTPGLDSDACKAITRRDSDKAIEEIKGGTVNLGFANYEGIDYELEYKIDSSELFDSIKGEFNVSLLVNQWLQINQTTDPADPEETYTNYKGGTYYPDYRASLTLGYQAEDWHVSLITSYRSSSLVDPDFDHESANYDEVYPEGNGDIPAIIRHSLYGGYYINDTTKLTFGVRNLANAEPPRKTSTFWGQRGVSDIVGRTYNLGISIDL